MPVTLDSAQEAILIALSCLGLDRVEDARVVRIKNTLKIAEVDVSENLLPEVAKRDDLSQAGDPSPDRLRRDRLPPAVLRIRGQALTLTFRRRVPSRGAGNQSQGLTPSVGARALEDLLHDDRVHPAPVQAPLLPVDPHLAEPARP